MAPAAPHRLSVSRTSAAAGLGLGILMVLCWIGAFIPFASPTLFGLVSGAILAMTYNLFARLER